MTDRIFETLFLCTGNSARSILAEAILGRRGEGRFHAHSAGSQPSGVVHPMAIEVLVEHRLPVTGLRSKSWDELAAPGAPRLDLVFTVCDRAAGETCPIWPGRPITAHWGIDDPAAVTGPEAEQRAAFQRTFALLERRIDQLTRLPLDALDRRALASRLDDIGRDRDADR